MRRLVTVIVLASVLVPVGGLSRPLRADDRPNIVVIMTDDQRWDALQTMPTVKAQLRDRGVTFSNAFVPNALCCPSRSSTLTGLHSHTTGVWGLTTPNGGFGAFHDGITIATKLHDEGYRTMLVGVPQRVPRGSLQLRSARMGPMVLDHQWRVLRVSRGGQRGDEPAVWQRPGRLLRTRPYR